MSRRVVARLRGAELRRRAQLLQAGQDFADARDVPSDPAPGDPVFEAAAETLTEDELTLLLAPGVRYSDVPGVSALVLQAITAPETLTDAERATVLAMPPKDWR